VEKLEKKELIAAYKGRKEIGGICVIKNTINGKMLLLSAPDLQGYKNRFNFSQQTGSCVNIKLQEDWGNFGAQAFTFDILEELEKKETQSPKEFKEDLKTLMELWHEKFAADILY